MHCSRRLIVQTLIFSCSYLHHQVSPPETLVVKGGTTWARNGQWILPENAWLPCNIQGSFTCWKSMTWDKRLYFPSEGRRAEDFFALKNPTASAGFEPANLGTKGQHATSRPPKPLKTDTYNHVSMNQMSFHCSVYLTMLSAAQTLPWNYSNISEKWFGKDVEGNHHGPTSGTNPEYLGTSEEYHEKPSKRTASLWRF